MEDMARLALVEQNVRDTEIFGKILHELLRHINNILQNPHDCELRTIKSETLRNYLKIDAFVDYLRSIGFQVVRNEYTYPKEHTLNNLRMAQAALVRKIYFCCGTSSGLDNNMNSLQKAQHKNGPELKPVKVLTTHNVLLQKMETMFNEVLQYESYEAQEAARDCVPLVTLQLMALDEMREQQRKIKTGEIKGPDMPFDIALLKVLLSWYKHRFFTWVDTPSCKTCDGETSHYKNSTITTSSECCNIEIYRCVECNAITEFPRYNDAKTLLQTRRGRCGEWANCFTLIARALGYDARLVYCTSDHVWCEIWDYDSNMWLHADPCEGTLDAPLTYAHGWGKQLSYVLAFSRDDLQDVTWRYTTQYPQVRQRRTECSEAELLHAILKLRAARQLQVSEARRRFLSKRCIEELVQFITERKVGEAEMHGRVSGSAAWRSQRGELGRGHVFHFHRPGTVGISYSATTDRYEIEGGDQTEIQSWANGVFTAEHIFRKVEKDWKMVYLARDEESSAGLISWKLEAGPRLQFTSLRVRLSAALYEDGHAAASVRLDDHHPTPTSTNGTWTEFSGRFVAGVVSVTLRGGIGRTAWQHAQLCRASLSDPTPTLQIRATLHHK